MQAGSMRQLARQRSPLDRLMAAHNATTFWRRFESAVGALGFCYYIYVFERRDGSRFHHTNFPAEFYAGAEHDPFLTYCCDNYGYTLTGADYMQDYSYLPDDAKAFIEQARGSGMRSGFGIPVRTRHDPEYGGFNLGTRLDRDAFEAGPGLNLEQARTLCLAAQHRINDLGLLEKASSDVNALALATLTRRERQVLDLLGSGLSRADVAGRIGVSPHTVATHVKNGYRKLGVRSQAQALALLRA